MQETSNGKYIGFVPERDFYELVQENVRYYLISHNRLIYLDCSDRIFLKLTVRNERRNNERTLP